MKKFLFLLASTTTLVMVDVAGAQYPPTLGGTGIAPPYTAPAYTAPGYTAPGTTAPGYMWREQRANDDWRNNTWREQRLNEDWRNNNWRQQRANEDWRQREDYEKKTTPNNAIDRGYVATTPKIETKTNPKEKEECGVGALKSSMPCQDYAKDKTKTNVIDKGYDPKASASPIK
jgi:hypothetical protein